MPNDGSNVGWYDAGDVNNIQELPMEKLNELDSISESYVHTRHLIAIFAHENNVDVDEVLERLNEDYMEDCSRADG